MDLPNRLQKIDSLSRWNYHHLDEDDTVYYLGDYIPREGYSASATNQFIKNFKKPLSKRGRPEWPWKSRAIDLFAKAIVALIGEEAIRERITFVPTPPSRARDDPDYDDRLWQTLQIVSQLVPGADCRDCITQARSIPAFHKNEGPRMPPSELSSLYAMESCGPEHRKHVIILDDVITTGSHFKAMQLVIRRHWPEAQIYGLFAARVYRPEPEITAIDLSDLLGD